MRLGEPRHPRQDGVRDRRRQVLAFGSPSPSRRARSRRTARHPSRPAPRRRDRVRPARPPPSVDSGGRVIRRATSTGMLPSSGTSGCDPTTSPSRYVSTITAGTSAIRREVKVRTSIVASSAQWRSSTTSTAGDGSRPSSARSARCTSPAAGLSRASANGRSGAAGDVAQRAERQRRHEVVAGADEHPQAARWPRGTPARARSSRSPPHRRRARPVRGRRRRRPRRPARTLSAASRSSTGAPAALEGR